MFQCPPGPMRPRSFRHLLPAACLLLGATVLAPMSLAAPEGHGSACAQVNPGHGQDAANPANPDCAATTGTAAANPAGTSGTAAPNPAPTVAAPNAAANPELDSLALLGAGVLGAGGYLLLRRRRPAGAAAA